MLWTCVYMGGADMDTFLLKPYRKTHQWHPTSIWVRESPKNWAYTIKFALDLCKEYTLRYHKCHKCKTHLLYLKRLGYFPPTETRDIKKPRGEIGNGCTPFPLAMPEECVVKNEGTVDPVASYTKYYEQKRETWKAKGRDMCWDSKPKKKSKVKREIDID